MKFDCTFGNLPHVFNIMLILSIFVNAFLKDAIRYGVNDLTALVMISPVYLGMIILGISMIETGFETDEDLYKQKTN